MGLMAVPKDKYLKYYSYVLKLQGLIFATIFPFGYFLKFGVAWHDAGQPFNLTDVKFHPVRVAASDPPPPACQQDVASVHSTGT